VPYSAVGGSYGLWSKSLQQIMLIYGINIFYVYFEYRKLYMEVESE